MAVIKSSALGQARKSIGPTNYYRRAGVQISRSKPTFAPGRTFTPAQLNQQFRMKVVQAMMLTYGLGKCSNCANVVNNRLYNASSRYNRAVKFILGSAWTFTDQDGYTPEEAAIEFYDELLAKWSVGDVKGVPGSIYVDFSKSSGQLWISGAANIVSELLRLTNKRRRPSGQLGLEAIGVCGMIIETPSRGRNLLPLLPEFVMNVPSSVNEPLQFQTSPSIVFNKTSTYTCALVLFVADGVGSAISPVDIVALHCTDSFGIMPIDLLNAVNEDDRPVIE